MQVDPISQHLQTDEDIARAVQQGDKEAFGLLLERYEHKLKRYGTRFLARQEDIEDTVQDVFIRAYENIQGFDTTKRFSPWIYRIAHNVFVNELRGKKNRTVSFDFDTLIPYLAYDDPAETERQQKDMRIMLERCLHDVPEKYREVLVLHYFEDLSYKDIADVLQVPAGTIGVRLKRGKEALRTVFEKVKHHYGHE